MKRIKKIFIEDYLKGYSVIIQDQSSGCLLSLPNEKGRSGILKIDNSLCYVFNGEIPLGSFIKWENDGEYVTIYIIEKWEIPDVDKE